MTGGAPEPGHDRAVVSEERARAFLAEGELELLGRIPWASNATILAQGPFGRPQRCDQLIAKQRERRPEDTTKPPFIFR